MEPVPPSPQPPPPLAPISAESEALYDDVDPDDGLDILDVNEDDDTVDDLVLSCQLNHALT